MSRLPLWVRSLSVERNDQHTRHRGSAQLVPVRPSNSGLETFRVRTLYKFGHRPSVSPLVSAARGVNTQTNRPRINRASELATHPINAPNQNPSAIGLSLEAVQEITVQHVPNGLCKRQRREIEPRSPSNSVTFCVNARVPYGRPPTSVRVSNVF